jgi:hypothetical protein
MSSGPPSPVALVGSHFPAADDPPELDLDSDRDITPELDASNGVVEHVEGLVEILQVDDNNRTEGEEDIHMNGIGKQELVVLDDNEEGMLSPRRRQERQESAPSTPSPETDSMETESDRPPMGSSPPHDSESGDDTSSNGLHGANGFYEEDEATETDCEAPVPAPAQLLPRRKTPALNTPEHEIGERTLESPVYTTPVQNTLVLTPSPPPEDRFGKPIPEADVDMPTAKKSKKKPSAPKKKGQAASKKRAAQEGDDEGEVAAADIGSPKKKPKKLMASKPKKPASSERMTNVVGLSKFDAHGQPLYCVCRRPDSGKWMIACDGCEDWYHGECVKIREEDGDLIDKYYCMHIYRFSSGTANASQASTANLPPSKQLGNACVVYLAAAALPPSTGTCRPNIALPSMVSTS